MPHTPNPFSSSWMNAPQPEPEPHRRGNRHVNQLVVTALAGLPGARAMRVVVILALIVASSWLAVPFLPAAAPAGQQEETAPGITFDNGPTQAPEIANIQTGNLQVTQSQGGNPLTVPTPEPTSGPISLTLDNRPVVEDGSILPANRILLFYGFPGEASMGILGEYDEGRLLELLRAQAAEIEAADPSRPVKIGFEVITSVAQETPGANGSYLLDAPSSLLDRYTNFAAENDVLIFFDLQIGRRTVQQEVEGLQPWLVRPNVHLALDPEFSLLEPDWVPGVHLGSVHAADITWAQNYLADLARANGLPPKVLIVHQFKPVMIQEKETLAPVAGVQLVIDMDGWGPPQLKQSTYGVVISQQPIEYNGIKLFYKQDQPLMSPEDIFQLDPPPDVLIYQ